MSKTDLVLLHAPSVYDFRERSIMFGPVSDMVPSTPVFEMYPLGFTTMAEYLERHGCRVRIVNLAVLMLNRPRFDVERAIHGMDPAVFGIDLHWLPHAHGAVEIARLCKKHHPDTPVVFGGLSSSYFHEELASYPCVDYVLRGDSTEEPLLRLVRALKAGGSVADIPNLTWKDASGAVRVNVLDWVPSDMDAISLDYSYNFRAVIRERDMMSFVPFKDWLQYPVCASLTCRGCTHDCATCGGSAYSFREHFGRDRVAFRDPELLVRDIANIQRYIPGPIFVLNDFLQAGRDYTKTFVEGLSRIGLKNPIAFEFFKPPCGDFYEFLDAHLPDWSVEISVESHDDGVRSRFGKHHYTMAQVEDSIASAMKHGCSRFDLYFMTGIPGQSGESVLETPDYVRGLYERLGNDPRLLAFISPMAPFLDPGSLAFDRPEEYGYRRRATTLEEHRQLLLQPSWKHIMNYESEAMGPDEMVEATYLAAMGINEVKTSIGVIDAAAAAETNERIARARATMDRIDAAMAVSDLETRGARLADLKREVEQLNESTVCRKAELNWPARTALSHVLNAAGLWLRENLAMLFGLRRPAVVAAKIENQEA
ncbi:MAG: TIGR04190 family B12-binding domain/radical SAM domain protein [Actinobacteria bacterium]|nr:MAG: TIGR04190 family B12-binding domain/radical SAM domain protein [Actinomycetota bacterium]